MKTKFLGQAYKSRSPNLAAQTAINIFPESTEGNASEVGGFYGTPGLRSQYVGNGQVRGTRYVQSYLFAVIGSQVLRFNSAYVATLLGTLPNITGSVSIIDNGSQVAFAHSSGWHWCAVEGTAIAPVAGSPSNSILTTQDQYVAYTDGGGQFGLTALADLSNLNPLDIATAEGLPDDLVSIISDHRELWLFGEETTEIWSNTGAAFFPFERSPGGFIEQGCAAKFSPAKLDNSVFWLGRDRNGKAIIYRANAYIPNRISTHAIEYAINQYSDISDAIGFAYQEEGHTFYWLTFPSGDASWVYDVATGAWHQRAWLNSQDGTLHRHRANCYSTFNGEHVVGDWENGALYTMSLDSGTDDGEEIYRERAWEIPSEEGERTRIDLLELIARTGDGATSADVIGAGDDMSTPGFFSAGVWASTLWNGLSTEPLPSEPMMWLQVSRDFGSTWGQQRIVGLGQIGQNLARVRWRRLGSGRNLVVRVCTTMNTPVEWIAANVQGESLKV
jgi:hypothetical protein